MICKISNFNMWTAKHLAQASCTELTLKEIMVKFLQRLPLQLPSTWSAHFEFVFFFFLGKICHFIDGLQHSPFYRWKSRCCFFFNDSYTNHYFMRIMFSLWGQSTWSIYQIQGSQIYILQHNVYSKTFTENWVSKQSSFRQLLFSFFCLVVLLNWKFRHVW